MRNHEERFFSTPNNVCPSDVSMEQGRVLVENLRAMDEMATGVSE